MQIRSLFPALTLGGLSLIATACTDLDTSRGDDSSSVDAGALSDLEAGSDGLFEAEDYHRATGCTVASNHPGYSGEGFMDYGANGTWIQWNTVRGSKAGTVELSFRYANGSSDSRRAAVIVNGVRQGNLEFAPTGGWSRWAVEGIEVPLKAGDNVVRVRANTVAGGPNLDRMEVDGGGDGGGDDDGGDDGGGDDGGGDDGGGDDGGGSGAFGCGAKYETDYDGHIILADDNKDAVLILKGPHKRNWDLSKDTLWRWDVSDARDASGNRLGSSFTSIFSKNKNDAKPVWYDDSMHILVITNAGDGVALIRLSDKRVVFWKDLGSGGAHSGAVLPDGNIVLADSQKKKDGSKYGAAIVLSTTTGKMQHCWQAGAHGAVWDHERQRVWVWGGSKMVAYEYNGDKRDPELRCGTALTWGGVGDGGGHDLTPKLDGSRKLIFTGKGGIYWFDTRPGKEEWGAVDDTIGRGLKAVSYNPATEEYIYVKAESDSRSDDVRSLSNPFRTLTNGKWYKARWFLPNCFSWPAE